MRATRAVGTAESLYYLSFTPELEVNHVSLYYMGYATSRLEVTWLVLVNVKDLDGIL